MRLIWVIYKKPNPSMQFKVIQFKKKREKEKKFWDFKKEKILRTLKSIENTYLNAAYPYTRVLNKVMAKESENYFYELASEFRLHSFNIITRKF